MSATIGKIAITLGGGYLPGLAVVVHAVARAAQERGWAVVGLRDGFDGLLFPERYPDGGIVEVAPEGAREGSLLGTGARTDPFRLQRANDEGFVEEVDASETILQTLRRERIDALVGIVGGSAITGSHALSVLWKLSRKGLRCVAIPKSAENDLAATDRPFGYDSVCRQASQWLHHIAVAARDQRRVALVEVPGHFAGHLALDAGCAAGADVILLPEIPYEPLRIARHLDARSAPALIVVAEGVHDASAGRHAPGAVASLPFIHRAGQVARQVTDTLQRHTRHEILPLVIDPLVRAGPLSETDRLLGEGYGQSAVDALAAGLSAELLAASTRGFDTLPLASAVNRVRLVAADSPVLAAARAQGVCFGDAA